MAQETSTNPRRPAKTPRCIVIAGPNGAGKTTFAREYLPTGAGVLHFVNADLIAGGLSPCARIWPRSPAAGFSSPNSTATPAPALTSPSRRP